MLKWKKSNFLKNRVVMYSVHDLLYTVTCFSTPLWLLLLLLGSFRTHEAKLVHCYQSECLKVKFPTVPGTKFYWSVSEEVCHGSSSFLLKKLSYINNGYEFDKLALFIHIPDCEYSPWQTVFQLDFSILLPNLTSGSCSNYPFPQGTWTHRYNRRASSAHARRFYIIRSLYRSVHLFVNGESSSS